MTSLFCRHNRFTAECPICSKGTVLARETAERPKPARPSKPSGSRSGGGRKAATVTRYPHASVAPIEHDGRIYEVRLEQVPGGLRLGQWRGGELERKPVVLPLSSLRELFDDARGRGYVRFDLPETVADAVSAGRAGDMSEELRLEQLGEGFVRVGRWIYWPGAGVGWQLQEAPIMLPEKRFKEALGGV
jgi:hypothetical protein